MIVYHLTFRQEVNVLGAPGIVQSVHQLIDEEARIRDARPTLEQEKGVTTVMTIERLNDEKYSDKFE